MVSSTHESLILLFRNRTTAAPELLRDLHVQIPEYSEIRCESADLTHLRPAEYRADLVLILSQESDEVLGVIVEVQLARDDDKSYSWPAYVATLRARHRCPVCLLVITTKEDVECWARKSIELGPGTQCTPWVIGPSNMRAITELEQASGNVELSVLSAIQHASDADTTLAARIATAAIAANQSVAGEDSSLYLDLILRFLPKNIFKALEATMKPLGFEYQSEFARRYFGEGKAEGKSEGQAEGKVAILLKLLTQRFGPLTESDLTRVRRAQDVQLDTVAECLLSARTLEEALQPLSA
jgi:hypothetical protein